MIELFLSCPPAPVSSNGQGEHLFYSVLSASATPFRNSGMLTDTVGQDLPVAGFKGIAVVTFQTIPFWSVARPPQLRLPLPLFLAVRLPTGNRKIISRFSLPMEFSPLVLTGASDTGATEPPNPILFSGMLCALFGLPLGLPIIALPLGYLRLGLFARLVKYSILTEPVKSGSNRGMIKT